MIAKKLLHSWAEVDTHAFRSNLTVLSDAAKKNQKSFMLMIKANAYGHGMVEIAKIAQQEGAKFLGIAHFEEAPILREAGISCPLMLFTEPPLTSVKLAKDLNVVIVVSSFAMLNTILALPATKRPAFHLKFNTGLNRFGFAVDDIERIIKLLKNTVVPDGLLTHYSSATDNPKLTQQQFSTFQFIIARFASAGIVPIYIHASNSAATAWLDEKDTNLVRLGLAAYGMQPNIDRLLNLQPCLNWHTRLIALNSISKGTLIGYGGSWEAPRDSMIGILPVGYSDGFRRGPKHQQYVLCREQSFPVIGTIMMNHCFIDCTDATTLPHTGDMVTLIGSHGMLKISIETVAMQLDTTNEEVATTILPAMARFYN